ncbi:hypothetical protein BAAM0499_03090 [Bifidobacterium animalis subsp. animalis MCC 0499]|nr:hypothetical protein BAAM0499_03090 [Bifidobacterium animalis subsp. animalis MCC 0499]
MIMQFLHHLITSDTTGILLLSVGIILLAVDCSTLHRKVKSLQQQINRLTHTPATQGSVTETGMQTSDATPRTV